MLVHLLLKTTRKLRLLLLECSRYAPSIIYINNKCAVYSETNRIWVYVQMGFVMGHGLAVVVGLGLYLGSGVFSKDKNVIRLITIGVPVCQTTQTMYAWFNFIRIKALTDSVENPSVCCRHTANKFSGICS